MKLDVKEWKANEAEGSEVCASLDNILSQNNMVDRTVEKTQ